MKMPPLRRLGFRNLRSVWMTMVISNLILLLIPMAMSLFLYAKVEKSLENGANRSNKAMLEQLRISLDGKLSEVDKLTQQIVFDPKLEHLLKLAPEDNSPDRYKFVEFMRDYLSRLSNMTSNFILDYYVYFAKSDLVLKPGLLTDSRKFYDMYYSYKGMTYEQWRDTMLLGDYTMAYLPSATLLRSSENDPALSLDKTPVNVVTFAQSLPTRARTDIIGSFMILIDESQVKEMFAQMEEASHSSIYIIDAKGRTIMGTDSGTLPPDLLSSIGGSEGLVDYKLNGVKQMVSYTSSQKAGWKYVSITPNNMFMQQVNQIKDWTFVLFSVCLVVGLAAVFTIAYRNYSPLRKTVSAIMKGKQLSGKESGNEYEFILRAIEGSLDEENNLRSLLAQQTPVIRANYLSRLIRGQIEADVSNEGGQSLRFMDISFVSDRFAVMIVQLDSISRFSGEQTEQQWALARFIVSNVGTDMAQADQKAFAVELDRDRIAFLLNFCPEGAEDATQDVKKMAEALKQTIEERFKLDMTIAAGLPHAGAKSIGESYAEAVAALEYRIIKGGSTIIYFQDISNVHQHYYYPIEIEVQLVNFVRSGDTDNVRSLLDTIYAMNFESGSITPELGRCLFFNITSTFLKIVNSTGTNQTDLLGPDFDPIKDIFSYATAEAMHRRTKQLYEKLTCSFVSGRSDYNAQLLREMVRFMEGNLADPNLGLAMIADHFDMTPQYISTFFKKHSGSNLIDSIARRRVELAKQLMQEKELTNAQIAQSVGYTSDVVFIRAFKKIEGITPGKYRDNMVQASTSEQVKAQ